MIDHDVYGRFCGDVLFTAKIDCDESAPQSVKLGLAVREAVKNGVSLNGANLNWANLDGANLNRANLIGSSLDGVSLYGSSLYRASLDGASLDGANLNRANLNGVTGINDYIKCIQIETYPINYTSDVIQIGCQQHTVEEWRDFSDAEIQGMDGLQALEWWHKWKDWLFQTIELAPAKPTQEAA